MMLEPFALAPSCERRKSRSGRRPSRPGFWSRWCSMSSLSGSWLVASDVLLRLKRSARPLNATFGPGYRRLRRYLNTQHRQVKAEGTSHPEVPWLTVPVDSVPVGSRSIGSMCSSGCQEFLPDQRGHLPRITGEQGILNTLYGVLEIIHPVYSGPIHMFWLTLTAGRVRTSWVRVSA
jgi:hypothetical protein